MKPLRQNLWVAKIRGKKRRLQIGFQLKLNNSRAAQPYDSPSPQPFSNGLLIRGEGGTGDGETTSGLYLRDIKNPMNTRFD